MGFVPCLTLKAPGLLSSAGHGSTPAVARALAAIASPAWPPAWVSAFQATLVGPGGRLKRRGPSQPASQPLLASI